MLTEKNLFTEIKTFNMWMVLNSNVIGLKAIFNFEAILRFLGMITIHGKIASIILQLTLTKLKFDKTMVFVATITLSK